MCRFFHKFLKLRNKQSIFYLSEDNLRPLIKRAFEKYTVNDFSSAIAIYDKILDLNPLLTSELAMRAQCLEKLNFNLDAIDDYQTAIQINNSDGNLFGLLGLVFNKIGYFEKATEFLELSVSKGYKMYETNLKMLELLKDNDIRQGIFERCNRPENLKRRNKKDFEDDLNEIDRELFNQNLIKQIEGIKYALSLDSNNIELKKLYNHFYSLMN